MIYQNFPDYRVLVSVLLGATDRLNDRGAVCLTDREAAQLRQAGFMQAMQAGEYQCPPVPLDLLRPHPELARLAELWHGARALAPPPQPVVAPASSRFGFDPARRLRWWVHAAMRNPDQCRVLESFLRQPTDASRNGGCSSGYTGCPPRGLIPPWLD